MRKFGLVITAIIIVLVSSAWRASPTLTLKNQTGNGFTLTLQGVKLYSFSIPTGKSKFKVDPGVYRYSYYACGAAQSGEIKVKSKGTEIKISCSSGKQTSVNKSTNGMTGKIQSPKKGAKVPYWFEVKGTVNGYSGDEHLHLAVKIRDLYWPKGPVTVRGKGWSKNIYEEAGGVGNITLVLCAASSLAHNQLMSWLEYSQVTGAYPGIKSLYGCQVLDQIQVRVNRSDYKIDDPLTTQIKINKHANDVAGEIRYPNYLSKVPYWYRANGVVKEFAENGYLHLAVKINNLYWLKGPVSVHGKGWSRYMYEEAGGAGSYVLVVCYADPTTHEKLMNWIEYSQATGDYPGLQNLYGCQPLDQVKVRVRKSDSDEERSSSNELKINKKTDGVTGRIKFPRYLTIVPYWYRVNGTVEGFSRSGYLHLAVRIGDLYWLKGPATVHGTKWEKFIYEEAGGAGNYTLVVCHANLNAHHAMMKWLKYGEETGSYPGLSNLYGCKILDYVKVRTED